MLVAAPIGLLVGLTIGLLGAGGSILAVPALVFGAGMPVAAAIALSLVVVGASAVAGLLPRRGEGLIRWRLAAVFAVAGVPAAFGGAALSRLLPDRWLMLGFAVLMALVAARMVTAAEPRGQACRRYHGRVDWRTCLPKAIAAGVLVGALTGLFGVGGGFVLVPAMTLLLGVPATEATSTSLVVVAANAVSGLAAHTGAVARIDPRVAAVFGGAAVLAALGAAKGGVRLPARALNTGFAVLVLVAAVATAVAVFAAPTMLTVA